MTPKITVNQALAIHSQTPTEMGIMFAYIDGPNVQAVCMGKEMIPLPTVREILREWAREHPERVVSQDEIVATWFDTQKTKTGRIK